MAVAIPIPRRPVMPALTGLRAFTATNIVFFHFWNPAWFGPLAPMMDNGYVGVNFFFLLSGFILAYNYSDRSDAGKFDRKQFWQTRFSRLYPVYVVGLLISIPILELEWQHRTHAQFFRGVGLTAIMQQGWDPRLCTFWNTPAWTLSCETVFYLLFPLLVAIKWPKQIHKLVLILAGCWLASLIAPTLYMLLRPDGLGTVTRMSNSYWLRAVKMTPLPHLPTFTAGIVLSKLNDRMQLQNRTRYWLAIVGLGTVCAVLMQGRRMPFLWMHNGLITPLFAITILGLTGHHPITRFLRFPLFVAVGEASYCLYILHFNLWRMIHESGMLVRLHIARFDPWISYFMLEIAALLVYRFLERPTRNWLHQVLPALKHARGQFPATRVAGPQAIAAEQASEG